MTYELSLNCVWLLIWFVFQICSTISILYCTTVLASYHAFTLSFSYFSATCILSGVDWGVTLLMYSQAFFSDVVTSFGVDSALTSISHHEHVFSCSPCYACLCPNNMYRVSEQYVNLLIWHYIGSKGKLSTKESFSTKGA